MGKNPQITKISRFISLYSQYCGQSKGMLPVYQRWARIGPTNKSWLVHTPKAGLCLSAFVIVTDSENRILIGLPKKHKAWPEQGGLPLMHAAELEREKKYLLPATHLIMEENPKDAALRIARKWVGYRDANPSFMMIQSHVRPSSLWKGESVYVPGTNHWDICFVYTMHANGLPSQIKPWWKEMKFILPSEIKELGRGHLDILEESGFLKG
jgi:ADP-ribose pyrophosphatase YjhB (NUDIX family)